MSSKHSTQEEIAKQFDLPERQSKIDTLLREPEIYCICRSSDSTRFMIACDACEEWYHGDCVNITQSEANNIHHYYCQWCIEKDPSLEIEYKKKSGSSGQSKDKSQKSERKAGRPKKTAEKSYPEEKVEKRKGCGSCTGCLNRRDCGRCENCKKNKKKESEKNKKTCLKRICIESKEKDAIQKSMKEEASSILTSKVVNVVEEDDWVPTPPPVASTSTKKQKAINRKSKKKTETKTRKKYVVKDSDSRSSDDESKGEEQRQCYWYECLNAARSGSKYCSDECGIRLASDRIYRLLPGRIQEWSLTPAVAEEKNKKDLEDIRRKQLECRTALNELENRRNTLDAHIEKIQQIAIDPDADDEEVEEEEGSIACVTCGHEVAVKTCIKHMERCYNKYESQTSFGSGYKTTLEGTPIFCDFYNAANGTYCKRLKVLCPEHSKELKVKDTTICGYPLLQNVIGPTKAFCKISKKRCNRHHCWEKLRRAEIDLEKVRYWLKLDELLEQERQCKQALTNRAGVLGLLLHSTFDHELREKIQKQMAEAELKQKLAEEEQMKQQRQKQHRMHDDMNLEYDDFEMKQQPSKSREHRKAHAHSSSSSNVTTEEMTASKLYKRMASGN
ncbi:unnamed protein product [Orchesella dallaii]|uniref:CXXC-type zinc finger protein 1 n=1 Tax=Orchesella dallaii TaxID=48710 RepID=A0ABP1PUE8_9HEXA